MLYNKFASGFEGKEDYANLKKLRKTQDYLEGVMPTDDQMVYIGTLNNKRYHKKHLKADQVISYYRARRNLYLGKVFNPEGRKEPWTYHKNQAFMLGVIEQGKTVILVTPKSEYDHKFLTTTTDELLWLKDNGYTFSEGKNDTLICTPPTKKWPPIIRNYKSGSGHYNLENMLKTRREILGFEPKAYTIRFEQSKKPRPTDQQPQVVVPLNASIREDQQPTPQQPQVVVPLNASISEDHSVANSIKCLVGSLEKLCIKAKACKP